MMFLQLSYPLFVSLSFTILAKPLQASDDQTFQSDLSDLRLSSQSSSQPLNSNATSSLLNESMPNDLSINCNGEAYGFEPDIEDCTNLLSRQEVGRTLIKFGQRGSISPQKFFPLPYRIMGGMWPFRRPSHAFCCDRVSKLTEMLLDEALCYLQPVLLNGAEFGSATFTQIRDAASDLVLKCASRAEQGGIANNIGM